MKNNLIWIKEDRENSFCGSSITFRMAEVPRWVPLSLFRMRTAGFGFMILFLTPKDHPKSKTSPLKGKDLGKQEGSCWGEWACHQLRMQSGKTSCR